MMNSKQSNANTTCPGPSAKRLIASLHRQSRQTKRISPTNSMDKSGEANHTPDFEKQPQEQEGLRSTASVAQPSSKTEELANKNQASPKKNDDSYSIEPTSSPRRRRDTHVSSWNRCTSWHVNSFSTVSSTGNDDNIYCTLDDSGREGEHCLDISNTKQLSLMDVLQKDEMACIKNTLTPRAA